MRKPTNIFTNLFLLRCYADCLLVSEPRMLLGSIVRSFLSGKRYREVLAAIEHHAACKPSRQGRQLIGHLDSATQVERSGELLIQISGWLFHRKRRIVSLVMFDESGAPSVADIDLPRPDLFICFPHERFAAMAGFRFVTSMTNPKGRTFTFRAILADDSVEYGSFEPCQISTENAAENAPNIDSIKAEENGSDRELQHRQQSAETIR